MDGVIFDIQRNSFVDGPGIRTTVFFKGCNLRCAWCHNPESQSAAPQMMFYANKCTGCGKCKEVCPHHLEKCDLCGKCAAVCPAGARKLCGKRMNAKEVLAEILPDRAFYDASGGGVTFSGGECMLQIDFLEQLLQCCKENGVHTAVDTAGCVPWEHLERILPYTDLFLYDVKCFSEDLHQSGTGVSNREILANLRRLCALCPEKMLVRVPLIPGFNDGEAELRAIADLLRETRPAGVEVLPYHRMGEHKYEALGKKAETFAVPDADTLVRARALLESAARNA